MDQFPTYFTVNKETPDGRSFGFGKSFLLSAAFLSCSDVDDGNKSGDDEEDNEEEEVVSETVDANENPDEDFDEDVATAYDFLLSKEDLGKVKTELIEGDKPGSKWLVLDDVYILYKYGYEGKDETFWECSERRRNKCRFKAATVAGDDLENPTLSYSYKFDIHECNQNKVDPIIQKFKTKTKKRMQTEYKNKFRKIFEEEKKNLLKEYKENNDLLETILYKLKDRRSYRNMANRARERNFPRNPRNHEEIDLSLIGLGHLLLGRCAHQDPEVKDKEVFLFGTPLTAEAFAKVWGWDI